MQYDANTKVWAIKRTRRSINGNAVTWVRTEWLTTQAGEAVISRNLWELYLKLNDTDLKWLANYKNRTTKIEGNKLHVFYKTLPTSFITIQQTLEICVVTLGQLAEELNKELKEA